MRKTIVLASQLHKKAGFLFLSVQFLKLRLKTALYSCYISRLCLLNICIFTPKHNNTFLLFVFKRKTLYLIELLLKGVRTQYFCLSVKLFQNWLVLQVTLHNFASASNCVVGNKTSSTGASAIYDYLHTYSSQLHPQRNALYASFPTRKKYQTHTAKSLTNQKADKNY